MTFKIDPDQHTASVAYEHLLAFMVKVQLACCGKSAQLVIDEIEAYVECGNAEDEEEELFKAAIKFIRDTLKATPSGPTKSQ